ncbi:hypothetical protein F5X97DRAFT_203657 [Nemania serpens]|nr:hypothetical protein F5X97DRAFT_203657 [Nemania serpens]
MILMCVGITILLPTASHLYLSRYQTINHKIWSRYFGRQNGPWCRHALGNRSLGKQIRQSPARGFGFPSPWNKFTKAQYCTSTATREARMSGTAF